MHRAAVFWLLAGLLCLPSLIQHSAAQQAIPQVPQLPVKGYILQDFHSGRVLAEENGNQRLEPASITKIMTAYIVYAKLSEGAIKASDLVTISRNAYQQEGSRMFININSKVSIADLLMGVVVQSGNDASVALAEYIAGSEAVFAELMNRQAAALGLANTHYVNATGLPHPEHYTTAADIAILVRALISHHPQYYSNYSAKEFTYNDITQHNRNKLLWRDESVDGVKTGHTSSAGFCLASSAQRDSMRLIAVVLGAGQENDRFSASQQLLDYGFRFFETHKLYAAGHVLTEAPLWKGAADTVALGFPNDVYLTIPRGRYQDMQAALRVSNIIEAPIQQGQSFGGVQLQLDGQQIATVPLIALQDVAAGSTFSQFTDHILLIFKNWLN